MAAEDRLTANLGGTTVYPVEGIARAVISVTVGGVISTESWRTEFSVFGQLVQVSTG